MLISHSKNIAWRVIDGKAYIVNTGTSCLHSLDEVGAFIWQKLHKKCSAAKLVDLLLKEYDVEKTVAADDVTGFISELKEKGLIEIQND
ncbi:MAG: hypothetical protein A2252_08145 [Elusimicrobia bacterium RIFOXYA2_FULL_39_19]|nr:MAG: hypothetical protein A2252_08145 [Elusimicrobia bacterium RIFOXYA2_FULL_39_19]